MKQPNAPTATDPSSQSARLGSGQPGELRVAAPPGQSSRADGPPSIATTHERTLAPIGVTLHGDPLTGAGGRPRPGWLVPVGVSLVTALVVFAIGGLVVRGMRSAEPAAVVAPTEPAAAAPNLAGVELREAVKPTDASRAAAPSSPAEKTERPAAEPPDKGEQEKAAKQPASRPAAARPASAAGTDEGEPAAPPEVPTSVADYLPGTL